MLRIGYGAYAGFPIPCSDAGSDWLVLVGQKPSCIVALIGRRAELAGAGAAQPSSPKSGGEESMLHVGGEHMPNTFPPWPPFGDEPLPPSVCASFIFCMAAWRIPKMVSRSLGRISSSWLSLSESSRSTFRIKASWSSSTGLPSCCALRITCTSARMHCLASSDMRCASLPAGARFH